MNFLSFRYRYDDPPHHGLVANTDLAPPESTGTRAALLSDAVRITPALFPDLSRKLAGVGEAMMLTEELDCFVTAGPVMQAHCLPHSLGGRQCFSIVLSSALIERLTTDEVRFVIGHEVGHFLCEHWRYPSEDASSAVAHKLSALKLSRAAEISADRIGLLACRSLEQSCGAMIKVAAGLGAPHLQPDIPSLLSQFRELAGQNGSRSGIWATHPIIPLRIRALLRFEPVLRSILRKEDVSREDLHAIDDAVEKDFHRSTGNALVEIAEQQLDSVRVWGSVFLCCADGVICKSEQSFLTDVLGKEKSAKIMQFLKSQTGSPALAVERKLVSACEEARSADLEARRRLVQEFESQLGAAGLLNGHSRGALDALRVLLTT
jgi:hypothetical protein